MSKDHDIEEEDEEIIEVGDYLKFVVTKTKDGPKVSAFDSDGYRIARKKPCRHAKCLIQFIAEVVEENYKIAIFESISDPRNGGSEQTTHEN